MKRFLLSNQTKEHQRDKDYSFQLDKCISVEIKLGEMMKREKSLLEFQQQNQLLLETQSKVPLWVEMILKLFEREK